MIGGDKQGHGRSHGQRAVFSGWSWAAHTARLLPGPLGRPSGRVRGASSHLPELCKFVSLPRGFQEYRRPLPTRGVSAGISILPSPPKGSVGGGDGARWGALMRGAAPFWLLRLNPEKELSGPLTANPAP